MKIERAALPARQDMAASPEKIFVIEGNLKTSGRPGSNGQCRDLPNLFSIATSWAPGEPFSDVDGHEPISILENALVSLADRARNKTVVWPIDGIGSVNTALPPRLQETFNGMVRDLLNFENEVPEMAPPIRAV